MAVGIAVALLIREPATPALPTFETPVCETLHTVGMADDNEWYYCLKHHKAEQGKACWYGDRMGPYPDQATAEKALEIAKARNKAADDQDD
ncbi:hypothetical protein AB0G00_11075 [Nocardia salmonicida]|uniref:hypothetical protein n=1 Tax=Nocardia salmonicida TaxID=53431 RepID=UPI0033BFC663